MVSDDCVLESRKDDLCTQWYLNIHLRCVEVESAVYARRGCTVVVQARSPMSITELPAPGGTPELTLRVDRGRVRTGEGYGAIEKGDPGSLHLAEGA
jgi:hypothetical protein